MFKSKLQELCHQRKWALPIYSCMKDGADHSPQFKASVVVNGINFDSLCISRSLKEAHNEAAKLAFLHFTSDEKATVEGSKSEQRSKGSDINSNALSNEAGPDIQQALKDEDMNSIEEEVLQNYKSKLQKYAQTKKLDLPLYRTKREEQSDALCFTAKVLVGEDIFKSPGLYKTTIDAEDAAAQAALISLSMVAFRESDDSMYKNLLQEFAQDNGFFLPKYKTIKSGEGHKPTFFSTVEIEGEIFHGNPAKSKKLAEFNAAKVAYNAFMQGKSCLMDDTKDESLEVAPSLDSLAIADQQRNFKPGPEADQSKDEDEETDSINNDQEVTAGSKLSRTDSSRKKTADPSSNKTREEIKTFLLCNRVRVYTCIPEMTIYKGNVALPIAEGKWVVVNLEFPNEKNA